MPSVTTKHERILGDVWQPLSAILSLDTGPLDLASRTVKFLMLDSAGTEIIAATEIGVTKQPTQAVTFEAATDLCLCNDHGAAHGDRIKFATADTLPAVLNATTRYYAQPRGQDAFAATKLPSGEPLNIADAGTGAHTFHILGSVQFDFPADAVDEAGEYKGYFLVSDGGETQTFPNDEFGIPISVVARGG